MSSAVISHLQLREYLGKRHRANQGQRGSGEIPPLSFNHSNNGPSWSHQITCCPNQKGMSPNADPWRPVAKLVEVDQATPVPAADE